MSQKTVIICNPNAGSMDDHEETRAQLAELSRAEIRFTKEKGDATRFAQEAVKQGAEIVLAAGGDGTLNEVVNGIAPTADHVRLGLIPLGTGNDFARMLELPSSVAECLEVIRAGNVREIDLVRVTSDQVRYFLNVSAGGFSGTVNDKMTPEIKENWGPLAYLRCAAEALPELRAYRAKLTLDDTDTLELDLYNVVVANGRYVAGGTLIAPEASIDDGLLDLILIPKNPALDLALVAAQIALGKHLDSDGVVFRRAARVAVESTPGMWFNVDGELVGNEPAVFEVMPKALKFIAGEGK